jgi:hypothetical protein
MSRQIARTLDMEPMDDKAEPKPAVVTMVPEQELEQDLFDARENIKEIAITGMQAISEVADIASQSQSDKHYMALSSVMKSTLEANRELLEVHRTRMELKGPLREEEKITNNLFVGSTADLMKMLAESRKLDADAK